MTITIRPSKPFRGCAIHFQCASPVLMLMILHQHRNGDCISNVYGLGKTDFFVWLVQDRVLATCWLKQARPHADGLVVLGKPSSLDQALTAVQHSCWHCYLAD